MWIGIHSVFQAWAGHAGQAWIVADLKGRLRPTGCIKKTGEGSEQRCIKPSYTSYTLGNWPSNGRRRERGWRDERLVGGDHVG